MNESFLVSVFIILVLATATMASDLQKVSSANNVFTNKLFKELSKTEGNVFFSPLSVHTCLSMLAQGSKAQTTKEMESALGVGLDAASKGYEGIIIQNEQFFYKF